MFSMKISTITIYHLVQCITLIRAYSNARLSPAIAALEEIDKLRLSSRLHVCCS